MTSDSFRKCPQYLRNPDILNRDKLERRLSLYLKIEGNYQSNKQ